ncbi:DNA-binding protein [Paracoccus caeni]|uniref:DNA-binding protein n=1 Tax=Paracoccus caeni TaxID=657651 RepID=A0A934SFV1_9RHOB|nr:DNA-binding protein [Paracoccus caeni]MBK4216639.1 DNA-binding protein [Paracoccus caeni]
MTQQFSATQTKAPKVPHRARVVQKRAFVDRVLAATGAAKADVRPIIEATLDELGRALSAGETLAVPPLGRGRVSIQKNPRGGDVITLRLRRRRADIRSKAANEVAK